LVETQTKRVLTNAGIITILGILGALGGGLLDVLMASEWGLSNVSDAFFLANTVPTVLAAIFLTVNLSLVPVFVSASPSVRHRVFNTVVNIGGILLLFLSLGLYFVLPWLIRLIAPGSVAGTLALALDFARILVFSVFFLGMGEIFKSVLNTYSRFTVSASANLVRFGTALVIVILSRTAFGANRFALSLVVGSVVQFVMLSLAASWQVGYRYQFVLDLRMPEIRQIWSLTSSGVVGISLRQFVPVVERAIASFFPAGSIAALGYAYRINEVLGGFFLTNISTAILPEIAIHVAEDNLNRLRAVVRFGVRAMALLSLPLSAFLFAARLPIITLFFQRGSFSASDVQLSATLLAGYAPSLLFLGHFRLSHSYYYARKKAWMVMLLYGTISGVDILLNLLLPRWIGLIGIPVAFSLASLIAASAAYLFMVRAGSLVLKDIVDIAWRLGVVYGLLLLCTEGMVRLVISWVGFGDLFAKGVVLALSMTGTGIMYLLLCYLVRIKEPFTLIRYFVSSLHRKAVEPA
jgi:putative peptidoglycan lipid II flippase